MDKHTKTSTSFTWGMILLFVPVALGMLYVLDVLPSARWAQVSQVVVTIACVGLGTYLAFWGKRPRRRRGDWLPSDTLPKSESP